MVEIDVTCNLESFRRFLVNSTCRSFIPESYMRDPEVFPEKEEEPGSIYIGSARHETAEYFKDREKSASIRRGSLVTLGDVGYFDDDGFLFLCDRKIDMIISGGVNIYPAEVEACLLAHDAVADVAVIGVPDDDWGESVKAIVEPRAGIDAGPELADELAEHCRERIARFKCPRSIDFVAVLPRLPNGKIEKRRLREPYWAGQQRAI